MTMIFRISDRIRYKIDDLEVAIRPLSYGEKMGLQQSMIKASQGDMAMAMDAVVETVKLALKEIKGIKNSDGSDYTLEFTPEGKVTDDCIDELLNLPHRDKLTLLCSAFLNGVPTKVVNPQTGEAIEGVKYIEPVKKAKK